jgi:hypothetical protein
MFFWTAEAVASIVQPEPTPGTGVYRCTLTADQHVVITAQNTGGLTLIIGSVAVQFEDAKGQPQGDAVTMFLPAILKLAHHIEAGQSQTVDLGPRTQTGTPVPARCEVTGSSPRSGNGAGSILSGY